MKKIEAWQIMGKCSFLISVANLNLVCGNPVGFEVWFDDGSHEYLCEHHFYHYLLWELKEQEKQEEGGEK